MTTPPELKELERETYKATHTDGVIDVFVGASMLLIGLTWIMIPNVLSGATAGVAIAISPTLAWRRRFMEARTGYVVFAEPRRLWERRIYTTAAILFGVFMVIARPLGTLQTEEIDWLVGPDSLVVWLVAAVLLALAAITELPRLYAYAAVLIASGAVAVPMETEFGWPLVFSGLLIAAVGVALVRRFVKRYPLIAAP